MERSEHELVEAYRGGDIQALAELVERYRRPLLSFIIQMTGGQGDADDVHQEVWLRAIRSLGSFENKSFLSWLFRIAHNLVIDRSRSSRKFVSLEAEAAEGGALEDYLPAKGRSPDEEAACRDLGTRVRQLVGNLPAEQKEVFVMRTEGGLPFREIARIQRVSINTALARMQYALAKLRKELRAEHGGETIA